MPELTLQQAFDLALQHHQAGRLAEAEPIYRQILAVEPNQPETLYFLGVLAHQTGCLDEAIALLGRALALRPAWPEALSNLSVTLHDVGRCEEAIAVCRQAIALRPNYDKAYNNLGNALKARGFLNEAIAAYQQALALKPDLAEAHNNLGNALHDLGDLDQALAAYRQALALNPRYAEACSNLGNVLYEKQQLDEATEAYQQALALKPEYAEAYNNLGVVLKDLGRLDDALAAQRQALARRPRSHVFGSSFLLTLHYHPASDAATIAREHRSWAEQHVDPLKHLIQPHTNDRTPERRLRIGYVSPDFREHAVARLLLPLLANHERQNFEIFAYAQVTAPDRMTERLQGLTDAWRSTVGLSDQQVAELVRRDKIDILVDLAGHTANNRLLVFAQKPAPVQVTCLGYPNTTGLSTIDYRLTDALADPSGETEAWHSEQLIRLPDSAWCIELADNPAPRAQSARPITFGCFNNMAKVTEPMLRLWAQLLRQVPDSRLLLKSAGMGSAACRNRVETILGDEGISPNRLDLRRPDQQYGGHLAQYHDLDIALDPYPYHGTVSTCEALWMGVPVVTLAGQSHVSRVGVSLLTNVGLPELIAATPEEYVRIAVELANDLPRLTALRSTLRDRMRASPLSDGPAYTRQIEAAYRQMWRTWCEAC